MRNTKLPLGWQACDVCYPVRYPGGKSDSPPTDIERLVRLAREQARIEAAARRERAAEEKSRKALQFADRILSIFGQDVCDALQLKPVVVGDQVGCKGTILGNVIHFLAKHRLDEFYIELRIYDYGNGSSTIKTTEFNVSPRITDYSCYRQDLLCWLGHWLEIGPNPLDEF